MKLESYLPAGTSVEAFILAMVGITALVTLLAVWSTLLHRDPAVRRVRMIAEQRDRLRA